LIGLLALSIATWTLPSTVSAKTPGSEYCFHGTCHRVKTLDETRRLVGITTTLKASFYDDPKNDRYNPSNITSSGEYFRSDRADNAASPIYPDGTKLLVWHPASRKALTIRVNNAGPYWGDRKLDLSRAAADVFGFRKSGVASVQVRVLEAPSKAESTYKKGRNYPSVKGYMGQFASLDAAVASTGTTRVASAEPDAPKTAPVTAKASAPALGLLDARALKSFDPAKAGATAVVASLPRRVPAGQASAVAFR
jgi:rare lipoprotein A